MYSINTHTLRWVACWQRVKRILMSLVHAAKHKDKANTSTLPTCSCFKCLLKVNKSWDTNCTCKYLKNIQTEQREWMKEEPWRENWEVSKYYKGYKNQYCWYILILKGVVKTGDRGDGWESMWRNREFSPELHYDLLTERETERKTCPLTDLNLNIWMFGLLRSLVTAASVFPSHVLGLGSL